MPPKRKRAASVADINFNMKPFEPREDLASYKNQKINHELDPKGDTIVVLRPSPEPFAVWNLGNEWPNALDQATTAVAGNSQNQDATPVDNNHPGPAKQKATAKNKESNKERPPEVLYRLSSRHLVLSCAYFQKLFEGPWKESGTPTFDSPRVLVVEEWREEPLSVLMNIIHGRLRQVPKALGLELMAQVAVLVDYYQCHEVMEILKEMRLSQLPQMRDVYNRDLILHFLISWVFLDKGKRFESICETVLHRSRGPIQTLGLPIPSSIVDYLDHCRQRYLSDTFGRVQDKLKQYSAYSQCSPACDLAVIGGMSKLLLQGGILFQLPSKPYYGYSLRELTNLLTSSPELAIAHENRCHLCSVSGTFEIMFQSLNTAIRKAARKGLQISRETHRRG